MTGTELKRWRLRKGWSRRALAEKLDVTAQSIYWWETGAVKVPTYVVRFAIPALTKKSEK